MKSKKRATKNVRQSGTWMAAGAMLLSVSQTPATVPVIYSGPIVPVSPELLREQRVDTLANSAEVFIPASEAQASDLPELFRNGPWGFRPHFDYQFLYGSGIQSTPGISGITAIHTLTPGFQLEYGKHWALGYSPTFTMYSNDKFRDTVGHSVFLSGATTYNDWSFNLSQNFSSSEQVLAETGGETFQQTFATSINASRVLNDKMSADFGFAQRISDTDSFQSSRDWSLSAFLNYQFWDRLTVSGGGILGYVSVDTGPDQVYEDLQVRANWRITDKMGLAAHAGGEVREFLEDGIIFAPVYGATFQYQPRERTQFSFDASRTVSPSLFAGQVTESTSLGASLTQQLFKKFSLSVGASFNIVDFTSPNGNTSRSDDSVSYNARLSHPVLRRGSLSLIYQFGDNQSSDSKFSYRTDQFGAAFSYAF